MAEEVVVASGQVVRGKCIRQYAETVARKQKFLLYRTRTGPCTAGNATGNIDPARPGNSELHGVAVKTLIVVVLIGIRAFCFTDYASGAREEVLHYV